MHITLSVTIFCGNYSIQTGWQDVDTPVYRMLMIQMTREVLLQLNYWC